MIEVGQEAAFRNFQTQGWGQVGGGTDKSSLGDLAIKAYTRRMNCNRCDVHDGWHCLFQRIGVQC